MAYQPEVGDIIKMQWWHGVVLKVFRSEAGGTVLKVQTARNVLRGYGPELIEVEVAPGAILPATRADLEREIAQLTAAREDGLRKMFEAMREEVAV
ncbi:MAG: hypothetical protein L6R45_29670 [Anaerolineae bacterium]|nr:hypothetical protein [Anaerolineae bacterium]